MTRPRAVSGVRILSSDLGYGRTVPFEEEPRGQQTTTTTSDPNGRSRGRAPTQTPDPGRYSSSFAAGRGPSTRVEYDFCELYLDLRGDYRARRGQQGVGYEGVAGEIPEFAPAAEYENNPCGIDGARLMCIAGGRQIHFVAETILRRAGLRDKVTFYAYSFDHPTITRLMSDAAARGADVVLYMDAKYLLGEHMSLQGTQQLADAMIWLDGLEGTRARRRGTLRIFTVKGRDATSVYERYDRRVTPGIEGACHAKVMYAYPYLITGSTNWSISSEANLELSTVLMVEDPDTRAYVERELEMLQTGAVEHFRDELLWALRDATQTRRGRTTGNQTRPRARVTG